MNPNKKAEELLDKFRKAIGYSSEKFMINEAKQCALICVDEIIRELTEISTYKDVNDNMPIEYWQQVKQLIINKK